MEKMRQEMLEQQYKTNQLLEKQNALFEKNNHLLQTQLMSLDMQCKDMKRLHELLERTYELWSEELIALLDEPLLDKNDVMEILRISDATYRRYVDGGKLDPMRLERLDWYYKRDLAKQLEASRLKGRL